MHLCFPLEETISLRTVPKIFCPRRFWKILCYWSPFLLNQSPIFCLWSFLFYRQSKLWHTGKLCLAPKEGIMREEVRNTSCWKKINVIDWWTKSNWKQLPGCSRQDWRERDGQQISTRRMSRLSWEQCSLETHSPVSLMPTPAQHPLPSIPCPASTALITLQT